MSIYVDGVLFGLGLTTAAGITKLVLILLGVIVA